MSVLLDKNVLVIGEESPRVTELEETLKRQKMNLFVSPCETLTPDFILQKGINVIILNHLHDGDLCSHFLTTLSQNKETKEIPIFALVDNVERKIQDALMMGAADYITENESLSSIVEKIRLILGEPANSAGNKVLDISDSSNPEFQSPVRVYVVEDDPLLKNLLKDKLDSLSFPNEFSKDATDIINKLHNFKPEVVLLDLMLPGKDGFEILSDLKQDQQLKSVPVIIFSNRDSQEDRQRCQQLGAAQFFVKAYTDLPVLIKAISDISAK